MVTPPDWLGPGFNVRIEKEETPEDAALRRRKDWVRFLTGLIGMAVIAIAALIGTFGPWATDAQRELAQPILTLVIGAFGGYIVGRNTTN